MNWRLGQGTQSQTSNQADARMYKYSRSWAESDVRQAGS